MRCLSDEELIYWAQHEKPLPLTEAAARQCLESLKQLGFADEDLASAFMAESERWLTQASAPNGETVDGVGIE